MSTTTFLTGSTGFIGSAVARLLLSKNHHLKVLCRPDNDRRNLLGLDVEIIEGDLTIPDSYAHALKGCNNLFHVAADYRIWVPDASVMRKINVDGTRNLMRAAANANIERIVYTSSVATMGKHKDGSPATELTTVGLADMQGIYKQSKFLAEQEVLQMVDTLQLPAVIVNPASPIGPRDIKPTPTGRIILDAIKGKMPAYVDTGLNFVHVDDVAMGHFLALEQGRMGERYILGGENLSLCEILRLIADIDGHTPPKIKLPCRAIYPIAFGMQIAARITGREPRVTMDALRMAQHKMYFSSQKAELELGYTACPAHQAITDAIDWFKSAGYA